MVSRLCSLTISLGLVSLAACLAATIPAVSEDQKCPETDTGLSLPSGFCATIFADKIGHARQLAVAPDGTVYVNTWSGILRQRQAARRRILGRAQGHEGHWPC